MKRAHSPGLVGNRLRRVAVALAIAPVFAAAWFGGIVPASAQIRMFMPPPLVHEVVPPPRFGHAWVHGHWIWQHGRYVWVPGHWIVVAQGVPAPPPTPPVAEVMRLSADALFAFDRASLADVLPGGRAEIRNVAANLMRADFGHVEVRGYTDRIGSVAHNQQLSQRRADTVKALLVRQGIPAERIDAIGFGMQDPITTHCPDSLPRADLITCLQPDRRVEIVTFARPGRRYGASPPPGAAGMPR
jgi:OmpA-OmpF porin, OOP family